MWHSSEGTNVRQEQGLLALFLKLETFVYSYSRYMLKNLLYLPSDPEKSLKFRPNRNEYICPPKRKTVQETAQSSINNRMDRLLCIHTVGHSFATRTNNMDKSHRHFNSLE